MKFEKEDKILLNMSPMKGVLGFDKKGKLTLRYVETSEIRIIQDGLTPSMCWFTLYSMYLC